MTKVALTLMSVCCSVWAQAQATLTFSYDAAGNQGQYRCCNGADCDREAARTLADSLTQSPPSRLS